MRSLILSPCILFLCLSAGTASPQESPGGETGVPREKDPARMLREIEKDMGMVETLLLKATAGKETAEAAGAAIRKLEKLLDQAKEQEDKVISALDEVIKEIRKRQREQKKSRSPKQQKNRKKQQGEEKKDPRFNNQKPENNQKPKRKQDPENKKNSGKKPPPGARKKADQVDKDGIWGVLPDKLFKLLTNREQTVFPPGFRVLLERYYQRLAESKDR